MGKQLTDKYPFVHFASDRSILIKFGNEVSPAIHEKVRKYFVLLHKLESKNIQSIHPAYNSILITFDPRLIHPDEMYKNIIALLTEEISVEIPEPELKEIPVCYDEEFALDILKVAGHNSISVNEVIDIHSRTEYLVYFLGFSPGFPYLGEMPAEISTPRLQTPRIKVPEGSVAIGGDHTGIYPVSSPGGWNIIGRTPLKLFSPGRDEPSLLKMGDKIKFIPITKTEFGKFKN